MLKNDGVKDLLHPPSKIQPCTFFIRVEEEMLFQNVFFNQSCVFVHVITPEDAILNGWRVDGLDVTKCKSIFKKVDDMSHRHFRKYVIDYVRSTLTHT